MINLKKMKIGSHKVLNQIEPPLSKDEKEEEERDDKEQLVTDQNTAVSGVSEMITTINELNETIFHNAEGPIKELSARITDDLTELSKLLVKHIKSDEGKNK